MFDAAKFGVSVGEVKYMDPQQRVMLEVAYSALFDAGWDLEGLVDSYTGVFVGLMNSDWDQINPQEISAFTGSGMARSIMANRVSYTLGLQGPSMTIDTACSSSLVAVHLAALSLQTRGCDARMLSIDGRCKTFDESANGYARGEGCGAVVLKRLSDCERDGDRVFGLVRGSAINQDGRSATLTAPNGPSQQAVIRKALSRAGLQGSAIDYVEAHGTGTGLGDPIEMGALKAVLGEGRAAGHPLVMGAAKSSIGHTEGSAGIAGLIKALLVLRHRVAPPLVHLKTLNPKIDVADFPVVFPTEAMALESSGATLHAGTSSFGFGGTNAHVVVAGVQHESPYTHRVPDFERRRFPWREDDHVLLGREQKRTSSDAAGDRVWECVWTTDTVLFLRNHRVGKVSITPGTAYLQLCFAAAERIFGDVAIRFTDVDFVQMLPLAEGDRPHLRTTYTASTSKVKVETRDSSEDEWTRVCTLGLSDPADVVDGAAEIREVAAFKERMTMTYDKAGFYTAIGNDYQGAFRDVNGVWMGTDEMFIDVGADYSEVDGALGAVSWLDASSQAAVLLTEHGGRPFFAAGVTSTTCLSVQDMQRSRSSGVGVHFQWADSESTCTIYDMASGYPLVVNRGGTVGFFSTGTSVGRLPQMRYVTEWTPGLELHETLVGGNIESLLGDAELCFCGDSGLCSAVAAYVDSSCVAEGEAEAPVRGSVIFVEKDTTIDSAFESLHNACVTASAGDEVWMVTRGSQRVLMSDIGGVDQVGGLISLLRVVRREHPQLRFVYLDLCGCDA
eukprot:UC1_evm1s1706